MGWTTPVGAAQQSGQNITPNGAYFIAISSTEIVVGTDPDSPSFITGLVIPSERGGFTIDSNGAVTNNTGRTIEAITGTISFQPDKEGGVTTQLDLWSELSLDGVVWTQNPGSLRTIEISSSGETFKTSISLALNWPDGAMIRFRMFSVGSALSFVPPSATVLGGEVVTGASAIWELKEM